MRLHEVAMVIGDDGGMQYHINKAIKNMEHYSKSHNDKDVRSVCGDAVMQLKSHTQNPSAIHDDPHSLVKMLSLFHGVPDVDRIKRATDSLSTYNQSDSD
jgi:hypothetical protein